MPERNWSNRGVLTNGGYAATNQKVGLQAKFGDIPEYYTVQFNVTRIAGLVQKTFAKVYWHIDGVPIVRIMNVLDGGSISGIAQAVEVEVTDSSAVGGGVGTLEYSVFITVGKGTRPTNSAPPVLQGFGVVGGTPVSIVPTTAALATDIPDDAGVTACWLGVTAQNSADAPIENDEILVAFFSGPLGTGIRVGITSYEGCNKWIPVPPGARSVSVLNNRAAGNILVDDTIWGVDG